MIKSAPYYWLECDGCGKRTDWDEVNAWETIEAAIDNADGIDWESENGQHLCPACIWEREA